MVGELTESQLLRWIPLLPLIGAFINGVFGRKLPKAAVTFIGCGVIGLAFVLAVMGSSARMAPELGNTPTDAVIVGIIESK
jgi:microcompartment protein CcmK/EutM